MKSNVFARAMLFIIAICLILTIAHVIYAIYAYQHCSIIQFIARELW